MLILWLSISEKILPVAHSNKVTYPCCIEELFSVRITDDQDIVIMSHEERLPLINNHVICNKKITVC